ncbi:PEP-CTERM sorting domain-containing protein [Rhodopila sp.]|uniref:PEP-CTERM sorting domain-containing protein n=1 Tax=Rhodopila sp. TaxID=2480087 RepID=UPI003D112666
MLPFKKTAFAGIVAAAALSASYAPASATIYDWTFSDAAASITGSGQLTTSDTPDGKGYDITSITGLLGGETVTGLVGGNPGYSTGNGSSPSILTLDGLFYYDNILYAAANSDQGSLLDNSGLLFSTAGHVEANIFGNFYDFGYASSISGPAVGYDHNDGSGATFAVAAVPEPASIAVVAGGLIGLGVIRRPQRRLAQARV